MTPLPSVLLVDDDENHRFLARLLLQRLNAENEFIVAEAPSGSEALENLALLVREGRRVLVLTDFVMPEMNGLDLLREVRKRHSSDRVRVAIFSSVEKAVVTAQGGFAVDKGDQMFVKPVALDRFQSELQRILGLWLLRRDATGNRAMSP